MRRRDFLGSVFLAATTVSVQAQRPGKEHRLAVVNPSGPVSIWSETGGYAAFEEFFKELRRRGYVEGHNLVVERYSGEGITDRYAELAEKVVRSKPDVIFAI